MISSLASERYVSLTTFKRDGASVSTPVWVVSDDGSRLLVWSGQQTWKVRRVRRDPRVFVAACTFRGVSNAASVSQVVHVSSRIPESMSCSGGK